MFIIIEGLLLILLYIVPEGELTQFAKKKEEPMGPREGREVREKRSFDIWPDVEQLEVNQVAYGRFYPDSENSVIFYKFKLENTSIISVDLDLNDPCGSYPGYQIVSSNGRDELAWGPESLYPGTYLVRISSGCAARYELTVKADELQLTEREPNDSVEEATLMVEGLHETGIIYRPIDEDDYFIITLPRDGSFTVHARNGLPPLFLEDEDGNVIFLIISVVNSDEILLYSGFLPAGNYYFRMHTDYEVWYLLGN